MRIFHPQHRPPAPNEVGFFSIGPPQPAGRLPASDPTPLGRTATIMGIGVTSPNRRDRKADRLQRPQRGFPPEPGLLDLDVEVRMPCSMAFRPASSAATCAA